MRILFGFTMAAAARSLTGHVDFQDTPEVKAWLSGPFFKAVCKVNATEFENARQVPDHVVLTESALGNREVAIVFKPRDEWPISLTQWTRMFKFLKLYRKASAA